MKNKYLVSVVIPTKNSEQFLSKCLESIRNQTYKNIEIIVVDNYSIDNTTKIAKSFGAKIVLQGPERSAQMNRGMKVANGDFVYRIDGDFVLDRELIEACVKKMIKENADACIVPNYSFGKSFWAKVRNLERKTYLGSNLFEAARFFKRNTLKKIKGFDIYLIACEDYDLHIRLEQGNYKIVRIEKYGEKHIGEPKSLREIFLKNYFYGKTIIRYFRKHPTRSTKQFFPIRFTYISHINDLIKEPKYFAGLIIMKLVQYFATFLGVAEIEIKVLIYKLLKKF